MIIIAAFYFFEQLFCNKYFLFSDNICLYLQENNTDMEEKDVNALLIHIEHSKPIEIGEFVSSLNAIGSLFSTFAQRHGESKELSQAKLYVEKIEEGCIDIILVEKIMAGLIPFAENMNIILDFSSYLKKVLDYFTGGIGQKPSLGLQEAKDLKDLLTITAGDNQGETSVGAIVKENKGVVYNNCTFNFQESNSAQNQLEREIEIRKESCPSDEVYVRQLMTIYQMRSDMRTDIGNKAIIDSISKKKVGVVFETDELKERILYSDENPTKKAFLVDVVVQTVNGKLAAYKVMALHDVVDLSDD